MKLSLSFGFSANPRSWPILDGRVKPDGVDLVCNVVGPSELFLRQLKYQEFDVSEMSFSSLLMITAMGTKDWVGVPIFTTRSFFHTGGLARKAAKIETAADLKGKRVGVPEYQQTAALWSRGVMQHDYGVRAQDCEWFMERTLEASHAGAVGFKPPPGVKLNFIPQDKSIGSMMLSGELDATIIYYGEANRVDRSNQNLRGHPDIKNLYPDPYEEGVRFFRKHGIYPINHGVVIRREIAEQHPWVLTNLVKAFKQAGAIADSERKAHMHYYLETGTLPREAAKAIDTPLVQHGVTANRKTLETAAQWSFEQGLTPRLVKLDEVFAPSTLAE